MPGCRKEIESMIMVFPRKVYYFQPTTSFLPCRQYAIFQTTVLVRITAWQHRGIRDKQTDVSEAVYVVVFR
jgi:hypothetical protein